MSSERRPRAAPPRDAHVATVATVQGRSTQHDATNSLAPALAPTAVVNGGRGRILAARPIHESPFKTVVTLGNLG